MMIGHTVLFALGFFVAVSSIASSTQFYDFIVMGKPISSQECTSDFWSKTCCWLDNEGGVIRKHCQTCLSDGYGGYTINCKTTKGPVAKPDFPAEPQEYDPRNEGGAVPGKPGTAAQDKSQSDEVIILRGQTQAESQTENTEPRQGTLIENLGVAEKNQD